MMRRAVEMIEAFERALDAQTAKFADASDEEITAFIADMLAQLSILIQFTAIPLERKHKIRRAIDAVESSLDQPVTRNACC